LTVRDGIRELVVKKMFEWSICSSIPANINLHVSVNGISRPLNSVEPYLENLTYIIVEDNPEQKKISQASCGGENSFQGPSQIRKSGVEDGNNSNNISLFWDVEGSEPNNDRMEDLLETQNITAGGVGLIGLQNIGNTCFMNSALQCLSNTEALTCYFLAGRWRRDLNEDNPLGMKGLLAEAYCDLLWELWSPRRRGPANPRSFKFVVAQFAPHFAGYLQHDAQELLSFVLDGLHEDLNRVCRKPLVESPAGDGTDDAAVAALAWERHRLRNDSVVLDLFGGQYRSELVCPVTGRRSVTFEPFTCLTLQLPQPAPPPTVPIKVVFHRCSGPTRRPARITVPLPRGGTFAELRRGLAAAAGVAADRLVLADVFGPRVYEFLDDGSLVCGANSAAPPLDIHAFETPVPAPRPRGQSSTPQLPDGSGHAFIVGVHRRPRRIGFRRVEMEPFGSPLLLAVPVDRATGAATFPALWAQVCAAVAPLCRPRHDQAACRRERGGCDGVGWDGGVGVDWCRGRFELRRVEGGGLGEDGEDLESGEGQAAGVEPWGTVAIDWTGEGLAALDPDADSQSDSSDDYGAAAPARPSAGPGAELRLEELLAAFAAPEVPR
jgi:hypothetical protein